MWKIKTFLWLTILLAGCSSKSGENSHKFNSRFQLDVTQDILETLNGNTFVANLPQVHPLFGRALTVKVRGINVQSIDDKNTQKSTAGFRQWHVFKRMLEGAETVEISNLERGKTGFWVWADLYLNGKFIQNLHE
jgi:hypothetical protein